ncbi:conserved hypothetical protein [Burkholderiales bacterium 8X]|nr:conserved hypothetical protein [Burkholderiales bacterium 8X]
MSMFKGSGPSSPLRMLMLAVLAALVLAQAAALVVVAQSQVQKAEMRAAMEQAERVAAERSFGRQPDRLARRAADASNDNLMSVGYVAAR